MDDTPVTPIRGYTRPSKEALEAVNENKLLEERLLRRLEDLDGSELAPDPRDLALAKTYIENAFMRLNRAIMKPQRVDLPED